MIAVDTNILIYAHKRGSPFHAAAAEAVDSLRQRPSPWAIPWPCIHEFIGIATHPAIYKPASTVADALAFVESLLASPQLHLLAEGPGYFERLREIATKARVKGPRIHDARIAALCLTHGVSELWSSDRDFALFGQLRVRNPLITS